MKCMLRLATLLVLAAHMLLAPSPVQRAIQPVAAAAESLNTFTRIGPAGAKLFDLAINPANQAELYAATLGNGLFKTTDTGLHWQQMNLPETTFRQVIVDPANPQTVYAKGNTTIYRSMDGGANWTPAALPSEIQTITLAPNQNTRLYACFWRDSANGPDIYRSDDSGGSWQKMATLPETGCFSLAVDPLDANTVLAGVGAHIYKSTDGGVNWAPTAFPDAPSGYIPLLHFSFANLFASSYNGLYTSGNGGTTWTKISPLAMLRLSVNPSNTNELYAVGTNNQISKSIDGGANWLGLSAGLPNSADQDVLVNPANPTTVYAATFNGIYVSQDSGTNWQENNGNLLASDINALAVDPIDTHVIFAAANGGVYRTTDGGTSWTLSSSYFTYNSGFTSWDREITAVAIDPTNTDVVYAATYNQVYKSTDRGVTWFSGSPLSGMSVSTNVVTSLIVDPLQPNTIYAAAKLDQAGIYKSTDGGINWGIISTSIFTPDPGTRDTFVYYALEMDPQNSAILYASAENGLYKSTDTGSHWTKLSKGLPAASPQNTVWAITVDPVDTRIAYASVFGSIYQSKDAGTSWDKVFDDTNIRALSVDPTNRTTVYAAGDTATYRSTDSGATWQEFKAGATVVNPASITIVASSPPRLLVATDGGSISAISFSLSGIDVDTPRDVVAGEPFSVNATLLDTKGNTATEYNGPVSLSLKGSGTLGGTTNVMAVNGIATFSNLTIGTAMVGLQLGASAGQLAGGTSAFFMVSSASTGSITESEPNNEFDTATPLVSNRDGDILATGLMQTATDIDMYTFTALPGTTVTISLMKLADDYNIALFPDPDQVASEGDGTDLGNISDIGWDSIGWDSIGWNSIGWDSIGWDSIGWDSIAASAQSGTTPERIQMNLARGGRFYVGVFGSNGAYSVQQGYTLAVNLDDGALRSPVVAAQFGRGIAAKRSEAVKTIFLTNYKRLDELYASDPASRATLKTQLLDPVLLDSSQGVVLDISKGQDPAALDRIEALYTRWDANPSHPLLANEVAQQIWQVLDRAIVTRYPNTENIVIVGGDDVIPFYRVPDDTPIGNELNYERALRNEGGLVENTPLLGSLHYGFFQTDDFYADRKPTAWRGRQFFLPDQATGRLVETPADIVRYLATYLADNGSMNRFTIDTTADGAPGSALVTGYDFLTDQAQAIRGELQGFGFTGGNNTVSELISQSWDTDQLETLWFGGQLASFSGSYANVATPFALASLNSHFTHYDLIPAQLTGRRFEAQRLYSPTSATNTTGYFKQNGMPTLVFSVGCHSGLSATDSAFTDPRLQADFAQAVLKQGGNWIGNTGYGIGDTDIVGYSERLALLFTRNIGRAIQQDNAYVGASIGESLALAKRQYLQTSGPNGFGLVDEKIMSEMTLYGLPFIRVKVPNPKPVEQLQPPAIPPAVQPTLTASEGLFTRVVTLTMDFASTGTKDAVPLLTSALVEDSFNVQNNQPIISVSTGNGRPVLPAVIYDLNVLPNNLATGIGAPEVRGVRLLSAVSLPDLAGYDPHVTTPISDQTSLAELPDTELDAESNWEPVLPYTFQRTAAVIPKGEDLVGGRPGDVTDKLIVMPTQFRAESSTTGTLRRFRQMVFEISYADPRTASDRVRNPTSTLSLEEVTIMVDTTGRSSTTITRDTGMVELEASLETPASDIARVTATYRTDTGQWQMVNLTLQADGTYSALVPTSDPRTVAAFFDISDNAGRVQSAAPDGDGIEAWILYWPMMYR